MMSFKPLLVGLGLLLAQVSYGQNTQQWQTANLLRRYSIARLSEQPRLVVQLSEAFLYVDPIRSRRYATTALELLQKYPDDTLYLVAVNNLAVAYGGLGQNKRADSCFRVGIRRAQELKNTTKLVLLLANQGATYLGEGRNRDALKRLRLALSYAVGPGHDDKRALLLNNIGLVYDNLGVYGPALRYYHAALREAERQHNLNVLGLAKGNIATIYAHLDNPQRSNQLLKQAIKDLNESNDPITANRCRLTVAANWLDMAKPDSARPLVWRSLQQAKLTQMPYQMAVAYVLLSRLYFSQQRFVQAEICARQALALAQAENQSMAGQAWMHLAKAVDAQGRTYAALPLAREAVLATQQTANKGERREANRVLADILERDGQLAKALAARRVFEALNDSLYTAGFREQFSQLQVTYETERKEQQIAFLNRENDLREGQLKWLRLGLGLVLMLLGLVYWLYRRQQIATGKISQQKELLTRQSSQLALLMRELHHRVKNNLQIVASLLSLQSKRLVDEQARAAVREGQSRVEAMAMLHQRLYATAEVTNINFRNYVSDLVESLMTTYGYRPADVDLTIEISHEQIETDTAIPLGLIINELITNSLKHAYQHVARPALTVRLEPTRNVDGLMTLRLTVADNGPGLPSAQPQVPYAAGAEWVSTAASVESSPVRQSKKRSRTTEIAAKDTTFGMQLVLSLARQLRAKGQFVEDKGAQFQLDIPMAQPLA
jgi:two-component sensor histidine kinase